MPFSARAETTSFAIILRFPLRTARTADDLLGAFAAPSLLLAFADCSLPLPSLLLFLRFSLCFLAFILPLTMYTRFFDTSTPLSPSMVATSETDKSWDSW